MPHNEEIARTVNSKVMMKGHPYQILWLLPTVFAIPYRGTSVSSNVLLLISI